MKLCSGLLVILMLLFLSLNVFSVEIDELNPSIVQPVGTTQESISNQQLLARISALEAKIGSLPTKENVRAEIIEAGNALAGIIESKGNWIVLSVTFVCLFILGLGYTFYFMLKAKRRI